MKRRALFTTAMLGLVVATSVGASLFLFPSNIDPDHKFSWSENAGWMNWLDADGTKQGVFVHSLPPPPSTAGPTQPGEQRPAVACNYYHLSGNIWMENAGWLNVGNGDGPYGNNDDTDFGVNLEFVALPEILDLDGFAWGENIGWVNFGWAAATANPDRARFDCNASRFRGYGWGENIGWVNLDDATHYVAAIPTPKPTNACTLGATGKCRTRALTFTMVPPATASSGDGTSAIKITSVDLYHQVPVNPPSRTQPNFSTFDTVLNNACTGAPPAFPRGGYYCQTTVDCQPQPGDPAGSTGTCPTGVGCTAAGEGNACARWVGPPFRYLESRDSPSLGSYLAARTQCEPYYQNWNNVKITVLGSEIVPMSTYDVTAYGSDCKGSESSCTNVSAPVQMKTRRGGDVATPYTPPTSSSQPEGPDVALVVNKFKNLPDPSSARVKAITQVQSNAPIPNNDVDGTDIAVVVDAVKGFAYAFTGPCICPSVVGCTATVCSGNAQCTGTPGNYGAGALCVRTCATGPNLGKPCSESPNLGSPPVTTPDLDCGACSAGSPVPGLPCDADGDCSPGTCSLGHCGGASVTTTGFCRDRCGRCD